MKIKEILNEAVDVDSIKAMSISDQYEYAKTLSQDELQELVDGFTGFQMWHVAFTATLDDFKRKEYESQKNKEVKIDPTTIFYRGTQGKGHDAESRSDYATFVSDNPYQAASYAGPDGIITKLTLHPAQAIMFKPNYQPGAREVHHSFIEYDEQASKLNKGQALVVNDIQDSGGFTDGLGKSTFAKTNVAFTDSSIAKVSGKEPARKYFKS
jgi:hypothetical protein